MKLLIQRVKEANVKVDDKIVGSIDKGLLIFVGITHTDTEQNADYLAKKVSALRIFEDEKGKMNLNVKDVGGSLLIISQFTLYADCNGGNRPSFIEAARPELANPLYEYFCKKCEEHQIKVEKGIFGADMKVNLLNDGPVTIIVEK